MEYTFGGKYKLEHEIGLGGCGTFFLSSLFFVSFLLRYLVYWYLVFGRYNLSSLLLSFFFYSLPARFRPGTAATASENHSDPTNQPTSYLADNLNT